ncbi:uncharacterized protein LOC131841406 [Achroia grisella]|uniref:uncharacterized protein LOC131841406 n=1 Tax=Achroia grisella TaxID=688607 RepID=UPI0027D1FD9B|nr:uncharacterized protein LOC131841406 [Achroia grisella]
MDVVIMIATLNLLVKSDGSFPINEWIPISKNEILHHNFITSTYNVAINKDAISDTAPNEQDDEMEILRDGVIKMVTPQITLNNKGFENPLHEETNKTAFVQIYEGCIACNNDTEILYNENSTKSTHGAKKVESIDVETIRKPKAIRDNIISNNVIKSDKEKASTEESPKNEDIITEEAHNTYEVIEDFMLPKVLSNQEHNNNKYVYPIPKIKLSTSNNSNLKSFNNTLSEYNIENPDKLSNYALSRLGRNYERKKHQNVYIPFSIPYGYGYNSRNHLPVNPLLAVFLSNYGYYLPSLYGLHNNYRNLYGYLASHNIHNNLPFGYYKIFSDTDSSN